MSSRPPARSTELARRQRVERNLSQQTAWQGCPWWGGKVAIRGHGPVLPCGLGRPGGFACQEVWTKLLWLSQNRSKVMAVPPAAFVPPGCREKGEWLGCAELLHLPAGHRMRDSLLPCPFRMEEQVAWCGRDTGTDQVILNSVLWGAGALSGILQGMVQGEWCGMRLAEGCRR